MKTWIHMMGCAAFLTLGSIELSGCGSPPPPPTAKKQIGNAEDAIESGNSLMRLRQFELAVVEYEKALSEIRSGEGFATGNEATRLGVLKDEARSKKVSCEFESARKASEAAVRIKARDEKNAGGGPVNNDAEIARKKAADAKEAAIATSKQDALSAISKTPGSKKNDEPEDAGDVAATTKPKAAKPASADGDAAPDAPAVKAPPKDKNGIFPDVNDSTPVLTIPKLMRIGKFVIAYCQINNKTDDGKRVTIYNYFKDHDNQIVIQPMTTASFPYDRFSAKVKDLIGDQSVRNLAPDTEAVNGHEFLQFVSVGECNNEENAMRITKLYLDVRFSDGTKADLTSADFGAGAMKTPKISMPK